MIRFNHLLAGVAAAGLLAAAPAFADEDTETGMSLETFESVDVNGDGYVDETEWSDNTGTEVSIWTAYDLDADGRLDADEWGAFEEGQMTAGADVSNQADTDIGAEAEAGADDGGTAE